MFVDQAGELYLAALDDARRVKSMRRLRRRALALQAAAHASDFRDPVRVRYKAVRDEFEKRGGRLPPVPGAS